MATVAYYGIPGSYSYDAALQYFTPADQYVPCIRFADVFDAVKKESCEVGVIPIENSLAGSVYENYDLLSCSELHIVGETYLKIEHCLLGVKKQGFVINAIKKVFAHPQALAQCSQLFEKYPFIEQVAYSDNASAAQFVAQEKNPAYAAIASSGAAKVYSLEIMMNGIANAPINYTRFLVVGRELPSESVNKCSVVFNLPHKAGSLSTALKVLSDAGMNLTKIESRPMYEKPFEYVFYVDIEFSEHFQRGVLGNQFKKAVGNFKLLGLYRSGMMR